MGSEQSSGVRLGADAWEKYTKARQRQARIRTQTFCDERGDVNVIDDVGLDHAHITVSSHRRSRTALSAALVSGGGVGGRRGARGSGRLLGLALEAAPHAEQLTMHGIVVDLIDATSRQ